MGGGICFKEQRYDNNGNGTVFVPPGFDLGKPMSANAGMENLFKFSPRDSVFEDDFGEVMPAQLAVRGDYFFAKGSANFIESRLAGRNKFTRQKIGIRDFCAALLEKDRSSGLAHTDTASQAEKFHRGVSVKSWAEIGKIFSGTRTFAVYLHKSCPDDLPSPALSRKGEIIVRGRRQIINVEQRPARRIFY